MSWRETNPMEERMKFIVAYQEGGRSITDLCNWFNISRKTGYKWISRYKSEGVSGLEERSRAPHSHHNKISEYHEKKILQMKCDHLKWGPRKIITTLSQDYPKEKWPAASTAGELLKRNGLVQKRKRKKRVDPYSDPLGHCNESNSVWSIDYKGQFRLGNGEYCYPLTITDNFSRFILACDGFNCISGARAKAVLKELFIKYGLPKAIRSDNGSPFAGRGLAGLSELSAWWLRLGIKHERIRPGHPEENGRHERMHRTLKEALLNPPEKDLLSQRIAFNAFIHEYNYERPHEGINNQRPAWIYQASKRPYPCSFDIAKYPRGFETRMIRHNGAMKWGSKEVFISQLLHGERIGLKPMTKKTFMVFFMEKELGIFNLDTLKVSRLSEFNK